MVSDGTEFAVGDIERLFEEARRNTETKHENWKKYYNRRRRDCKLRVLDVKNNNVVIWKAGKRLTINVDQVRIYRHRKCDETEIGTGSPDNGSLRDESSGFDKVQRRSNDSRDGGKKKGSEVKRELEDKGLSFRNNQGEKHINKTNKLGPLIRSIPSSWSEKERKAKQKKTVKSTTSGYNLRPRNEKGVESRPTIEKKTQQRGPVQSRKGRGRNDSTYIEERTRSSNKNARRGGDQQRQDQERRGVFHSYSLNRRLSLRIICPNLEYLGILLLTADLILDSENPRVAEQCDVNIQSINTLDSKWSSVKREYVVLIIFFVENVHSHG
ncbi:uncharacterized protein TNCV_5130161 [Trichonephila clavipes]|nr:uncharacterized protein TNCV_5130161 [Trichonephila clavipes]